MNRITRCICCLIPLIIILAGCGKTPEDSGLDAKEELAYGRLEEAQLIIAKANLKDSTGTVEKYGKGLVQAYNGLDWDALMSYLGAAPGRDGYRPAMDDFTKLALDMNYLGNGRQMARVYINKFPNSPEGYLYLSDFYARHQMLDSAEFYLGQALEKGASEPEMTLIKTRQTILTGSDREIVEALQTLSKTSVRSAEHLGQKADLYHSLYMGDSAIYYARQAVDKDSKNIDNRLRLAQFLFDYRRLRDAKTEITNVLNTAESCGRAYLTAAYIERALGNLSTAILLCDSFIVNGNDSPIALEKFGDYLAYEKAPRLGGDQYQGAYTVATNKQYPDDVITHLFIKVENSALEDKNIPIALAFFREAEDLYPELPEMKFFRAELMMRFKGGVDSAKILVDDSLVKNWSNRSWLDKAGTYLYRGNKFDLAEKTYRRLLQLPQPKLEYVTNLLDIYRQQNNVFATDTLAANMSIRFRNSPQVKEMLRDLYESAGEFDRALVFARELYRGSDQYMPYIISLAGIYASSGQIDQAREIYQKYCEENPESPEGHYRLALFEFEHGGGDVMALVNRSLDRDSTYGFALELKGRCFERDNQMDSALALYRKVVDMKSPTPFAYYNLARHFVDTGDSLLRAEGLARSAQVYFGSDSRGYLVLGDVYMAQKKYKLARTQYFNALKLSPDDAILHFKHGKSLYLLKEYKDAKVELRAALDLNLDSPMKEEAQKILSKL